MKFIQVTLSVLLLMVAHVATAGPSPLDFVERVAKQVDYIEQQSVWPGFHPASTPSVVLFKAGLFSDELHAYAFNFKPGALQWWQRSTSSGRPVYYLPDANVLNLGSDDFFAVVDEQNSYIDSESLESFIGDENLKNTFIANRAEYYFSHEARIDQKHVNDLNAPFANFNNLEMLKLYYLEDAALTAAQQSDAGLAEVALKDAVSIHQYRNNLAGESARVYENAIEILKGIPVYIGWTSKQLSEVDYKKMTQRTGCRPLESMLGAADFAGCVEKGFPAFASSVYGHALERKLLGQPWKQEVERQFKSISQMTIDYYHLSDEQAKSMTQLAMKKSEYRYDRIERIINHTMTSYISNMQKAVIESNATPGVELRMEPAFGESLMLYDAFKPCIANTYFVDTSNTLLQDVNASIDGYDQSEPDAEGLTFNHLPFITIHYKRITLDGKTDPKESFTSIKLTDDAKLIIDGVSILAKDFVKAKKIQVGHRFVIEDQHLRIAWKEDTKLDASDGTIWIVEEKNSHSLRSLIKRS